MPLRALILAPLVLAACASAPRNAFPPLVNMHSPTLCYIQRAGNTAEMQAAAAELGARRFVCAARDIEEGRQQFATMAGHQRQLDLQARQGEGISRDAALGLGLILLGQPAPQPSVTCHTTPNRLTTICN